MKKQTPIHNIIKTVINITFGLCMIVSLWFVAQVFVFASFKIPAIIWNYEDVLIRIVVMIDRNSYDTSL